MKAAENWVSAGINVNPGFLSVVKYQDGYVANNVVKTSRSPYASSFFTSPDGMNWARQLQLPIYVVVSNILNYNDTLYILVSTGASPGPYVVGMRQSTDGISWEDIDDGGFPSGYYFPPTHLTTLNGQLYGQIVGNANQIQLGRIDRDNAGRMHWTTIPMSGSGRPFGELTAFHGFFYTVFAHDNTGILDLSRSQDGRTWETLYSTSAVSYVNGFISDNPFFEEINNDLYWVDNFILKISTGTSFSYEIMPDIVTGYLFGVNGIPHATDIASNHVFAFLNGQWKDQWPTPISARSSGSFDFFDTTILYGANLKLKRGLYLLENSQILPGQLSANQTQANLLKWTLRFNLSETITEIKVTNVGTAIGSRDLTNLRLLSAPAGTINISSFTLASSLVQNSDSSWKTPVGFNFILTVDTDFYLVGDIAFTPQDQATVRFTLPSDGIVTTVNQTYFQSITADGVQTINGNTNAVEIVGANLYPQPATDHVVFQYTLESDADVVIQLFDQGGRLVSEIRDDAKAAALRATSTWTCADKAPGLYFALIKIQPVAGGAEKTFKQKVVIKR